jgi:hypothetical protein
LYATVSGSLNKAGSLLQRLLSTSSSSSSSGLVSTNSLMSPGSYSSNAGPTAANSQCSGSSRGSAGMESAGSTIELYTRPKTASSAASCSLTAAATSSGPSVSTKGHQDELSTAGAAGKSPQPARSYAPQITGTTSSVKPFPATPFPAPTGAA